MCNDARVIYVLAASTLLAPLAVPSFYTFHIQSGFVRSYSFTRIFEDCLLRLFSQSKHVSYVDVIILSSIHRFTTRLISHTLLHEFVLPSNLQPQDVVLMSSSEFVFFVKPITDEAIATLRALFLSCGEELPPSNVIQVRFRTINGVYVTPEKFLSALLASPFAGDFDVYFRAPGSGILPLDEFKMKVALAQDRWPTRKPFSFDAD